VIDPPVSESEFVGLWKLYFLGLIGRKLREFDVGNTPALKVQRLLEPLGLLDHELSLRGLLQLAKDHVRKIFPAQGVQKLESGIQIDPNTGMPIEVSGKIIFREPSLEDRRHGVISADEALSDANNALGEATLRLWILLDRLDVAFADSPQLETNALRALFRAYRDLRDLDNIALEIFLRSDIWKKVTETGFRESSHFTSSVALEWDRNSLLNLIVRRLVSNDTLCDHYHIDKNDILVSIDRQQEFLYRVFPKQVDLGAKKPTSFDWLFSRTADGFEKSAAREVIHLISAMRDVQLKKFERGEAGPADETLFDRNTFKEALPEVSKVRLEQTLFAEYPELRKWLLALRNKKTEQDVASLSVIWSVAEDETLVWASKLVDVGFFVKRTEKESPTYWVPFLYRDALEMVQGRAEEAEEFPQMGARAAAYGGD
jgi:hypothetical protein